jgi:hypothetical protein
MALPGLRRSFGLACASALLAGTMTVAAPPAFACLCQRVWSTKEAIEHFALIITAEAILRIATRSGHSTFFKVEAIWKGDVGDEIEIRRPYSLDMSIIGTCAGDFAKGTRYSIMTTPDAAGHFSVSPCGWELIEGTPEYAELDALLRARGNSRKPASGPRD